MDWVKLLGVVFLSVYLILTGLGVTIHVGSYDLVHFFAVVAGLLMLVSVKTCGVCHHDNKYDNKYDNK